MPSSLELRPRDIEEELKYSFIQYAMAVIINRALPDVRDGLKPVHRRILYSMWEMGLTPDKPYRKSARIVGDVLGKYHPHGDGAVYDAMVRMAQDFSIRYLLVEGQGNFGSVDGDSPAAIRYTEARLSRIAMELVTDIDKNTVDFYPNFDETTTQPTVFPARFPNLLVNGSGGIAVGMATNIPPHNLDEVIGGVIHMIDNPDCSIEELMGFIKGPDFPTYGIIMGTAGIREAYRTGRGRVVTRARAEIEQLAGNRNRIVVTEIPYQVNKARLLEKIDELVREKRLEGISEFHDESDRHGMRIVIDLKRDVNPQIVLNFLYKHTQMQDTFGVNMLALVDGEPKTLNLKQVLYYYIEHQKEVVIRRTRYDLEKAEARAHILQGLLIALDNIDAVIALIRASRDIAHARDGLMAQFGLSEKQASAILEMRLSRLTALERDKLMEEYNELIERIDYYNRVLADIGMVLGIIKEELRQVQIKFSDGRRTEITALQNEIDIADLIEEDDVVVTMTHFGYVKRLPSDTYRAQRRGGKGVAALSTRDEDFVERIIIASTHTDLMFFTNLGRVFRLKCYEIPEASRTARGTAIVNLLMLGGEERVSAVIPVDTEYEGDLYVTMATRGGMIKKTHLSEYDNIRKGGLNAISLREGDELCGVCLTNGQEVLLGTRGGMCIRFSTETELRPLGRVTMGVRAIDLDDGDSVVDMSIVDEDMEVLAITERGYGKRTPIDEYRAQSRAGKGVKAMNLTDKTGPLIGQLLVSDIEDVMLITDDGTVIRTPVSQISSLGRSTQGVRLMRTDLGSRVVAVARLAAAEQEDEEQDIDEGEGDMGNEGDGGDA